MTTFDEARLEPSQYNLEEPIHAIQYQKTVEDIMAIVRDDPAYLSDKPGFIKKFIQLLDNDDAFPLAVNMVPELRRPQSLDTSEDTIINTILRHPAVKHRRPPPPLKDLERQFEKRQIRNMIEFIWYDGGRENASEEEHAEAEDMVARAAKIIFPS
ncbi:hypothetical protein OHC33_007065 [Knufia fluminis]|uniref:Uncharacterized protein n=1 Tax=Knufia fluminis TaxID=191047 RepID=A0AAN8EHP5_9EURO|nr:hypothetical protein OHC33_007065 [Knufia fluminis]